MFSGLMVQILHNVVVVKATSKDHRQEQTRQCSSAVTFINYRTHETTTKNNNPKFKNALLCFAVGIK